MNIKIPILILCVLMGVGTYSVSLAATGSGACSWHGGVNCSVGPDGDASVICEDGWRDSSVAFKDVCDENSGKSNALILSDRQSYQVILGAVDRRIKNIEDIYVGLLDAEYRNWKDNIASQHAKCLHDNDSNYCIPYAVKNNYIYGGRLIDLLAAFSNAIDDDWKTKTGLVYMGQENGESISLNNFTWAMGYKSHNAVMDKLQLTAALSGDFLRSNIPNYVPDDYRELSQQIIDDIPKGGTRYYSYDEISKIYDRVLIFHGNSVLPEPKPFVNSFNAAQPKVPIYFIGVPKTKTDLLNCFVVGTKTSKLYYLRGSRNIKTMVPSGKVCFVDEAAARSQKYKKSSAR